MSIQMGMKMGWKHLAYECFTDVLTVSQGQCLGDELGTSFSDAVSFVNCNPNAIDSDQHQQLCLVCGC